MILAIDVGNTNVVIGCVEEGKVYKTVRIRTEHNSTTAEYAIKLKSLLEVFEIDPHSFEGAVMSSVVPTVSISISIAVKLITDLECLNVGPGVKTGMNLKIDDPSTVGCDLVVGGVAAIGCYSVPAIIMDLGTATTITLVDESRSFRGGAIIPGLRLSYAALASGTSLLPEISISAPGKVIATNTVDCMRSGAVYGTAAMIDGMIDRMEAEIGQKCTLIATGGLASAIIKNCSHEIIYDADLILKGLWIIYQKNRKQKN